MFYPRLQPCLEQANIIRIYFHPRINRIPALILEINRGSRSMILGQLTTNSPIIEVQMGMKPDRIDTKMISPETASTQMIVIARKST